MSHVATGKLNKPAHETQLGDGSLFFVNIGVNVYNRKTKKSGWVNYSAGLFAKANQQQFYRDKLVEGAIVSVTAPELVIDNDEKYGIRLVMQGATLSYVYVPGIPSAAHEGKPAHNPGQGFQQPQQRAPQNAGGFQQSAGFDAFDGSDIPF